MATSACNVARLLVMRARPREGAEQPSRVKVAIAGQQHGNEVHIWPQATHPLGISSVGTVDRAAHMEHEEASKKELGHAPCVREHHTGQADRVLVRTLPLHAQEARTRICAAGIDEARVQPR